MIIMPYHVKFYNIRHINSPIKSNLTFAIIKMKVFQWRKYEWRIFNVCWDSSIITLLDYELYYVDDDLQYFWQYTPLKLLFILHTDNSPSWFLLLIIALSYKW